MQPKPSSTAIQGMLSPAPSAPVVNDPPLTVPTDVAASMKKQGYNPVRFQQDLNDLQASGKADEAMRTYGLVVDRHRRNSDAFGQIGRMTAQTSGYQQQRVSQGPNNSLSAWDDFGRQFFNGAVIQLGQGIHLLGTAIPKAIDGALNDNKDWLREWQDANAAWYQNNKLFITPQAEAGVFDAKGDVNWRGVAGTMGQTLGMMAGTFIPFLGPAGKVGIGARILSTSAQAGAIGFLQMLPMYTQEARKAGYTPSQSMMAAIPLAAVQGLLEHFGMDIFTKAIGLGKTESTAAMRLLREETAKEAFGKLAGRELSVDAFQEVSEELGKGFFQRLRQPETLKRIISNVGKGTAEEGGEEFVQTWADFGLKKLFDIYHGNEKAGDQRGFDPTVKETALESAVGTLLGGTIGGAMGGMFGRLPNSFQQQTIFGKLDADIRDITAKGRSILSADEQQNEQVKAGLSSYKLLERAKKSGQIDDDTYTDVRQQLDSMAKVSEQLGKTGVSSPTARYALYDLNTRQSSFNDRYAQEVDAPMQQLGQLADEPSPGQFVPKANLPVMELAAANTLIAQNLPARAALGQQIKSKINDYVGELVNPDQREAALRRYAADIDGDLNKFDQSARPQQTRFTEAELPGLETTMETPKGRFALRQTADPNRPREVVQVNTTVQGIRPSVTEDRDPVIDRFRGFQLPTAGQPVVDFSAVDEKEQGDMLDSFDHNPDIVEPYGKWRTGLQNQYVDDPMAGMSQARRQVDLETASLQNDPAATDWQRGDLARKKQWVQNGFQQLAEDPQEARYNADDYIADHHGDWMAANNMDGSTLANLPAEYQQGIYKALKAGDPAAATKLAQAAVPLTQTVSPNDSESSPRALLAAYEAEGNRYDRRKIIEDLTKVLSGRGAIVSAVTEYLDSAEPDPEIDARFAQQLDELAAVTDQLANAVEQIAAEQSGDEDSAATGTGPAAAGKPSRSGITIDPATGDEKPVPLREKRAKRADPLARQPQSVDEAILQYLYQALKPSKAEGRINTKSFVDHFGRSAREYGFLNLTSDKGRLGLDDFANYIAEQLGMTDNYDEDAIIKRLEDFITDGAQRVVGNLTTQQQEVVDQQIQQMVPTTTPLEVMGGLFEVMEQAGVSNTVQERLTNEIIANHVTADGLDWLAVRQILGLSGLLSDPTIKQYVYGEYLNQVASHVDLSDELIEAAASLSPSEVAELMAGGPLSDDVFNQIVDTFALSPEQIDALDRIGGDENPNPPAVTDESDIPIFYPKTAGDTGTTTGDEENVGAGVNGESGQPLPSRQPASTPLQQSAAVAEEVQVAESPGVTKAVNDAVNDVDKAVKTLDVQIANKKSRIEGLKKKLKSRVSTGDVFANTSPAVTNTYPVQQTRPSVFTDTANAMSPDGSIRPTGTTQVTAETSISLAPTPYGFTGWLTKASEGARIARSITYRQTMINPAFESVAGDANTAIELETVEPAEYNPDGSLRKKGKVFYQTNETYQQWRNARGQSTQTDLTAGQVTGLDAEKAAKEGIAQAEAELSALETQRNNVAATRDQVAEVARQNALAQQNLFASPTPAVDTTQTDGDENIPAEPNKEEQPPQELSPQEQRRQELLQRKADLAKQLNRSINSSLNAGVNPETLRIGLEYFAVSVELGIIKFKDFVREFIGDTGATVGESELSALKAVYDASRSQVSDEVYDEMDDSRAVRSATLADILPTSQENEQRTATPAESDSPRGGSTDSVVQPAIQPAGPGSPQPVAGGESQNAANQPAGPGRNQRLPEPIAPLFGEPGNQQLPGTDGTVRPANGDAGTDERGGSRLDGNPGVQPEHPATDAVSQTPAASRAATTSDKLTQQAKADSIPAVVADRANIDATLPFLMEGQREDVHFAEKRLSKPDGFGVIFTNGTGTGKAQPLDAKILTPHGWKRMGDIAVGDAVIAGDGTRTTVTGVYPQGDKEIFRVSFSDGAKTECCDEHLWLTQTLYARRKSRANPDWNCSQPEVRSLLQIRNSLDKQHFIPIAGPIDHPDVQLTLPSYTMGVLLGDGCLTGQGITFSSGDSELAEYVEKDVDGFFKVKSIPVNGNRCPAWRIYSETEIQANGQFGKSELISYLDGLGLIGCNSFEKFIPNEYLYGSKSAREDLLRGLLDTDGTVDYRTGSISYTSVSPRLKDGVVALVRSLGGIATVSSKIPTFTHKGQKKKGQLAYTITIHLSNSINLFSLSRKRNLVTPKQHSPRRKVTAVVSIGIKQAQCISVDHPSHLYVTDDYIVTHNTFLGLGVIKRLVKQGKKDVVIVVPNDAVANEWVKSAPALGLTINALANTKDKGRGVVITTFANFGQNDELSKRNIDAVVIDEAQNLMQSAQADETAALSALRAITLHPDGAHTLTAMQNRDLVNRIASLADLIRKNEKRMKDLDLMDSIYDELSRENQTYEAEKRPLDTKYRDLIARNKVLVESRQNETRPRAVFLSATPFAYRENVQWAEGYLFQYSKVESRGYNTPSGYGQFMMTHFGYRMRYGKLTKPEAEVDSNLMERQFNSHLREQGVLSARVLDIDSDYERRFALTPSAVGAKIDEGLTWLREEKDGRYRAIYDIVNDRFDYLERQRLLEAIKANEAIPLIKQWHALGKKVVVFYDYNKGGGFSPFDLSTAPNTPVLITPKGGGQGTTILLRGLVAEFSKARPDLVAIDTGNLLPPLEALRAAFPNAGVVNGQPEFKKTRILSIKSFNDDSQPDANILLVQSAANAGWSGHDTSGKHPRVLLNLGMPTAPTKAIQQEGRVYRQGQHPSSNSMFTYLNTGTGWERIAFASTISSRASTAENLAMGQMARGLKDAFIQAFEDSDTYSPTANEGVGGKAKDRELVQAISDFDRARALYYAQEKKNQRTKAAEGIDYFATPEPLGLKLIEWSGIKGGESSLEPSAGHGAIARWFPDDTKRTIVEPSFELASRAALVTDARMVNDRFEDFSIQNKYDVIAMNPPFGTAGKMASDHLQKAATQHLSDGGRLLAIVPTGSFNDKFEKWFYGEDAKGKPLAPNLHLSARILLPSATFERAGTKVMTQVLVIDRVDNKDQRGQLPSTQTIDLTNSETAKDFFERIRDLSIRERPKLSPSTAPATRPAIDLSTRGSVLPMPATAVVTATATPVATPTTTPPATTTPGASSVILKEPIPGKHTKYGTDIFTVPLTGKLAYNDYKTVEAIAKTQDGYYSKFTGNGAIEGFIFKSADKANEFYRQVNGGLPTGVQPQYGAPDVSLPVTEKLLSSIQAFVPNIEFGNQTDAGGFDADLFNQTAARVGLINSPDAQLNGFRVGNKIYLNPAVLNAQTLMHETGHIWASAMRVLNPAILERGLSLMAGTTYERKFLKNPAYAQRQGESATQYRDRIREEALVEAIADKGIKILSSVKQSAFRQYMTQFWNALKSALKKAGIDINTKGKSLADATLEEYTDAVAQQMINGESVAKTQSPETATGAQPQFVSFSRGSINPAIKPELESRYQQAVSLAGQGMNSDEVWQQTGFFQNPASNGEWSYELDTNQLQLKVVPADLSRFVTPPGQSRSYLSLGELIAFPDLFAIFPSLATAKLYVVNETTGQFSGVNAAYDPTDNYFILNLATNESGQSTNKGLDQIYRNDLVHEIQHAIGTTESNPRGTGQLSEADRLGREISQKQADSRRYFEQSRLAKRIEDQQRLEEQARDLQQQADELTDNTPGIARQRYRNNPGEREARAVESRLEIPVTYDPQTGLSLRKPVPARGDDFTSDRIDAQFQMPLNAARPITNPAAESIASFRTQFEGSAFKKALKKESVPDIVQHLQTAYSPLIDQLINLAPRSKTVNSLSKLRTIGPFKLNPGIIYDPAVGFNNDLLEDVARLIKGQTIKYGKLTRSLRDILIGGQATEDWHTAVGGQDNYLDGDGDYIKADTVAETTNLDSSLETIAQHKGPWGFLTRMLNSKAAGAITLPETIAHWLSTEGAALRTLLIDTRRAWVSRAAEISLNRQQQIDALTQQFAGISLFDGRNPASQVATMTHNGYADGQTQTITLPVAAWMHLLATHRTQQQTYGGRSSVMADLLPNGQLSKFRYDEQGRPQAYGYDYKDPLTDKTTTYLLDEKTLDAVETEINQQHGAAYAAGKNFFNFAPALDYLKGLHRAVNGEDLVLYSDYFPTVSTATQSDALTAMPRLLRDAKILQARQGLPMRVRGGDMLAELQNYARREEHYIGNVATLINLQRWQQRHSAMLTQKAPQWVTDYLEELEVDLNDPTARSRKQGNWTEVKVGGVDVGLRAMLRRFTTSVFSFSPALPIKQITTMLQGVGLGIVDNKYLAQASLHDLAPLFAEAYNIARQNDEKTLYNTTLKEGAYLNEMAQNPYNATVLNRAVGRSESYIGQPSLDDLKANPVSSAVAGARKVFRTVSDYGLGPVRRSDRAVLLSFWRAAQYQVQADIAAGKLVDENGQRVSDMNDDAALKRVGELTEKMAYATNQMSSESDRSPLQRDRSLASTLIGLYSGQQQRLLNTFVQAYADWVHIPDGTPEKQAAFKQMAWVGFNNILLNAAVIAMISLVWRLIQKTLTGDDRQEDYGQTLAWDTARGVLGSFPSIPTEALTMVTTMTDNQKWSSGLIEYAPGEALAQTITGMQQAVSYLSEDDPAKQTQLLNQLTYSIADGSTKLTGLPNNMARLFAKMAKQKKPVSQQEWEEMVDE